MGRFGSDENARALRASIHRIGLDPDDVGACRYSLRDFKFVFSVLVGLAELVTALP